MESGVEPLSTRRMRLGLAAAAVAGLISYIVLLLAFNVLEASVATLAFGRRWEDLRILGPAMLYLIFGLPIALLLSFAVGLPIWKRSEARAFRSRRSAWILGASTGAVIGLLLAFIGLLLGLGIYFDDSSYNEYHYGYQVSRDGLPTVLGWIFELLNVIQLAVAGSIGGLTARWIALPAVSKR